MEIGQVFIFLEDKNERDRLFVEAFLDREIGIKLPSDVTSKQMDGLALKMNKLSANYSSIMITVELT